MENDVELLRCQLAIRLLTTEREGYVGRAEIATSEDFEQEATEITEGEDAEKWPDNV